MGRLLYPAMKSRRYLKIPFVKLIIYILVCKSVSDWRWFPRFCTLRTEGWGRVSSVWFRPLVTILITNVVSGRDWDFQCIHKWRIRHKSDFPRINRREKGKGFIFWQEVQSLSRELLLSMVRWARVRMYMIVSHRWHLKIDWLAWVVVQLQDW